MSRTRNAARTAALTYTQFALALVSGFVLFPLTIRYLGAYDNGLWIITGELAGYLLLGDLGVFGVLPWLVAAKDGAGDRHGIARHLADALSVGLVIGVAFVAIGVAIWWLDPARIGVNPVDWEKIRGPLTLVTVLLGVGFPLRAFTAVLAGLQDVTFVGLVNVGQTALTVTLTATLILTGYGMPGLAIATGLPPLLGGLAAMARVFARYRDTTTAWYQPRWGSSRSLVREGFGMWLAGIGVRLRYASAGVVFALLGRPDWATTYAATAKVAMVTQPLCWVIPDSAMIGLSQIHGEGDQTRTRRVVISMILLYLLTTGFVAIGILLANAWFVGAWLGPSFFAGNYVSGLIVFNLLASSALTGLYKVVGLVGYRLRIGVATLVYGVAAAGLGFLLGRERGMRGLAEGSLIAVTVFAIPYGLYLIRAVHSISIHDLAIGGVGRWLVLTMPFLALATLLGKRLSVEGAPLVCLVMTAYLVCYAIAIRTVLARVPWPERVRQWLSTIRMIPRAPEMKR